MLGPLVLDPFEWVYTRRIYMRELPMLNFNKDEEAAEEASSLCNPIDPRKMNWKEVTVVMPAVKSRPRISGLVIAVEGYTLGLLEGWGITPDLVVTDFDFEPQRLLHYGGIVVGHAHGDNIEFFREWSRKVRNVIPTVQVWPRGCSMLVPGFTDGDRAIYLAYYMGANMIKVYGFDPGIALKRDDEVKRIKLRIAQYFIERLSKRGGAVIMIEPH